MPTGLLAGGFAVKFSRNAMLAVFRDRSHHGSINDRLSIFCWFTVLLPIYQIWDNSNLGRSKEIIFYSVLVRFLLYIGIISLVTAVFSERSKNCQVTMWTLVRLRDSLITAVLSANAFSSLRVPSGT